MVVTTSLPPTVQYIYPALANADAGSIIDTNTPNLAGNAVEKVTRRTVEKVTRRTVEKVTRRTVEKVTRRTARLLKRLERDPTGDPTGDQVADEVQKAVA
jgi:hypothetical protein